MELEIQFDRGKVEDDVKHVTGYTAKDIGERVDNVMYTDDETALMDRLIGEALAALAGHTGRYATVVGTGSVTFTLPDNFCASAAPAMGRALHGYLTDHTLAGWFFIARLPDDHARYTRSAEAHLAALDRMLCSRTKS